MLAGQIDSLTGVRFVASAWVVMFHIQLFNEGAFGPFEPLARQGDLGVDLFFALSGFVLAHNYLTRLGPDAQSAEVVTFLWARLARIWPLYMVAVLLGGWLMFSREVLWGTDPKVPLTLEKLVQQTFLVQQWTEPDVHTSWAGPAWSLSAEWLAYLCFPALAMFAWRLRQRHGRRTALWASALVLVPILCWVVIAGMQTAPFQWLGRLAAMFASGVLLAAGLPAATNRLRRAGTLLTPVFVGGIVALCYVAESVGAHWVGALSAALFPALIASLVYGEGRIHRFLSTRTLLLGGGVSYALYLVHVPLIKFYRDLNDHAGSLAVSDSHRWYAESAVALLSLLLAYALFRRVEEPARRALRRVPVARLLRLHPDATVDADRLRVEVAVGDGLDDHRRELLRSP